jgi:hypothetical protein
MMEGRRRGQRKGGKGIKGKEERRRSKRIVEQKKGVGREILRDVSEMESRFKISDEY